MSSDRTITVMVGPTGAGKSYQIKETILPHMPRPLWVLDTQHEYELWDRCYIADGSSHPTGNPSRELLDALPQLGDGEGFIVRPTTETAELHQAQAQDFIRLVAEARFYGTILIDETDLFSDAREAIPPVRNLIMRGRHHGQHLIFACRSFANVSKNILRNADSIVAFRQNYEGDVKRLRRLFDNPEGLFELKEHEFMVGGAQPERTPYYRELTEQTEYTP